tara:strand:- start:873 stop:1142 length:270 start_codon:yes stop_codon:yes gene_type:complete
MGDGELRKKAESGARAASFLSDPIFGEAVSAARAKYLNIILGVEGRDKEIREEAYFRLDAIDDVVSVIKEMAVEGDRAANELKQLEERK